jgi:rhamnose utilization protein RhaD (predicted bifunctional aldolase and dehydrogenase)
MPAKEITSLLELAHALGEHPSRLTICDEGACAAKLPGGRFAVSTRGANLSKLDAEDLLELDIEKVRALSDGDIVSEEVIHEALGKKEGAVRVPSEDALLFAFLLGLEGVNFAAHTQPIEINQIICSPRARQFADRRISPGEILACGSASLLVPYVDPGLPLARELRRKMLLWRDRYKTPPRVVLLQNHGMIVLGRTVSELLDTTDMVLKSAQIFIGASMMGGPVFLTPNNVTHIESLRGT